MKTAWKKGLEEDSKQELTLQYNASYVIRDRLTTMLLEKIRVAQKGSLSSDAYNCPNWSLKQADNVGYQRALQEVISLLSD